MQDQRPCVAAPRPDEYTLFGGLAKSLRTLTGLTALTVATMLPSASVAVGSVNGPHVIIKFEAPPPGGAVDLCVRFKWACSSQRGTPPVPKATLTLARKINSSINRTVPQIEDARQYGQRDFWSLPTERGGDCEDFALLKKAALMQEGISPGNLLIATVLDRNRNNHAVLILRTTAGDYVLDSATSQIRLWSQTRYSFLKIQDPNAPNRWRAVLAGGVFG